MLLKQFQIFKSVSVFVLAMIVGASITLDNYLVPIIAVALDALLILYMRGKVKEIIADERDYAIGGKAARWTMYIYCWAALVVIFTLYAIKQYNPAYIIIANVLAYSACTVLIIYAVTFKYIERKQDAV
ncbi:MAG: DUF2178 domain-containing protein [Patescibacteria group bacterium]|nr:DUF2178 domain-containing protein [Patescibacteria group bacterium]